MSSKKSETTQNYNQNQNQSVNQTSQESYNQGNSGYQQTFFNPQSDQERSILNQYQGLGEAQSNYINQIMDQGYSPFTLSPADQATLDQAYAGALQDFNTQGKDYADYLATSRGLNKSDTPVSLQAMDRYRQGLVDLESQKANQSLNMGLAGSQFRLQGAQSLPAGLGAAFMPMFNERMAGGRTQSGSSSSGSSNSTFNSNMYGNSNGTSTTTQRYTPSLMDSIGQGMSLGSQALGLGAQIGGLMMGVPMPSLGGGGSGGGGNPLLTSMSGGSGANSWFGPGNYNTGGMSNYFGK